jgi:hypothetical protein
LGKQFDPEGVPRHAFDEAVGPFDDGKDRLFKEFLDSQFEEFIAISDSVGVDVMDFGVGVQGMHQDEGRAHDVLGICAEGLGDEFDQLGFTCAEGSNQTDGAGYSVPDALGQELTESTAILETI